MEKKEINIVTDLFKVFFITSTKSNLENEIHYSLCNHNGMTNLQNVLNSTIENDLIISVYSFDIIPKNIKEDYKDKETQKYQSVINLKYNKINIKGIILFKKTKNNFIYDFKFEDNKDKNICLQFNLNLNKFEQFKIYKELLKKLQIKQDNALFQDLINDSIVYLYGKNTIYYFDYYLEIFKFCFPNSNLKIILLMFKLEKVKIPNKFNFKEYSLLLDLIEKKPDIIIKLLNSNKDKHKFLKIFYTLLLYFRHNFEKEKVYDLLKKKELFQYFIEILPFNFPFFFGLKIPEDLIKEILRQKTLSYDIIEGTISYISTNRNKLICINNNIDSIFEYCKKNEIKLNIIKLAYPKESDNIREIVLELDKIINYQITHNNQFILLNEEYFNKYIEFDANMDLEKKN
jgi:hypothetical protein